MKHNTHRMFATDLLSITSNFDGLVYITVIFLFKTWEGTF